MTKFEQLMLRAQHAELEILRGLTHLASLSKERWRAACVQADIEYALTTDSIDERDETHG